MDPKLTYRAETKDFQQIRNFYRKQENRQIWDGNSDVWSTDFQGEY